MNFNNYLSEQNDGEDLDHNLNVQGINYNNEYLYISRILVFCLTFELKEKLFTNCLFSVAEKSDGSWILNLIPPDGLPHGSSIEGTQLHIVKLILVTSVC